MGLVFVSFRVWWECPFSQAHKPGSSPCSLGFSRLAGGMAERQTQKTHMYMTKRVPRKTKTDQNYDKVTGVSEKVRK